MNIPHLGSSFGGFKTRTALLFVIVFGVGSYATAQTAKPETTGEMVTLSPFTVNSEKDKGYGATYSTGSSRINLPLQDIPTTVVTLNEEFLKDIHAMNGTEAVKYVSGMNANGTPYGDQLTVRGFVQGDGISFRDGIADAGLLGSQGNTDFATVERIEVIKGPNGVLFGSQVPGGVINSVNKMPRPQRITTIGVTAGANNLLRVDLDTSGSIDSKKNLYYRFVFAQQRGETPQHGPNDKLLIYPALTWKPFAGTKITGGVTYLMTDLATSRNGWFVDGAGRVSDFVPFDRTFDEFDERSLGLKRSVDLNVEQLLWPDWHTRLTARSGNSNRDKPSYNKDRFDFVNAAGTVLGNQGNYRFGQPYADILVRRTRRHDRLSSNSYLLGLDIVGSFKFLQMEHKLLAYGQWRQNKGSEGRDTWTYPSTSVFRPVYQGDPFAVTGPKVIASKNTSYSTATSAGVQDSVYIFGDRVILVGGINYTGTENEGTNLLTGVTTIQPDNHGWSRKAGVIAKPIKGLALYYNYAETFQPVSGTNPNGVPWENQVGFTNEFGAKLELFEGRLTGTVSVFEVELDHFIRIIPDFITFIPTQVQAGLNRSKGFEADIAWQPTESVTMVVAYGDLTSKSETGLRQRGVPQGPNYKFFGKYEFRTARLKGFSLGGGYVFTSESAGDSADTFSLPAWETVDLFASYQRNGWKIQLNIYNLLDERYIATAVTKTFVYPGKPREWRASLSRTF